MLKNKIKYLTIVLWMLFAKAYSQSCPPSADCQGSILACNTPTFQLVQVTCNNEYGNIDELPQSNTISNPLTNPASSNLGCLTSGEKNPTWIIFTISSTGTLEFVFGANSSSNPQAGFYDWAMWPYNPNACQQIQNNQLAPVRCNYNWNPTGGTGIASIIPPGGDPGNYEPPLNVTAGQQFVLCLSNYSNINAALPIQISGSAGVTCNPLAPSVASQTICPGNTATLTATGGPSNPTYTWMPGNLTGPTVTVTPSATTVYTISAAGTNTATNQPVTTTTTATVTLHTLPTTTVSSPVYTCPGGSIPITASPGGTAYVWSGPNGFNQTIPLNTITVPNASVLMNGTYSVNVTWPTGCITSATTSINVIATSTIAVSGSTNVCQGSSITFSANAVGAISYNWQGPISYSAIGQQNTVIANATPNMTGTYTVAAIFGTGTSTCSATNTINVSVFTTAPTTLTPIPTVCNNGTINLTAPNGGAAYAWSGPSGYSSNLQNPSITNASPINNGIYSLAITNNGCVSIGTVNIAVYNALSIASNPASQTICNKDTILLNTVGQGGSGVYAYSWLPNTGLGLLFPSSSSVDCFASATTEYTVTLYDASCPITNSIAAVFTITVNPLPTITFSATPLIGCEPLPVDFTFTSTPPATTCFWNFGSGTQVTNSAIPITTALYNDDGVYTVSLTVTDVNGCVNTQTTPNYITVTPKPFVDFDWNPEKPTIIANNVQFEDKSSVGLPMLNWTWDFGDYYKDSTENNSTLQDPKYTYDNVGTYTVKLIVENSFNCIDSTTKTIIVEDQLAVYIPNAFTPSNKDGQNDVFLPQVVGAKVGTYQLFIYNRWGEQLFYTTDLTKGWDGKLTNGTLAQQGVYVYKVFVEETKGREQEFTGHISLF